MTVSDADRERVIGLLREQAGEGRLDMDEYGQRLDEAYQASTLEQLQHALRELPVPAIVPVPPPAPQTPRPPQYQQRPRQQHGPRPPRSAPSPAVRHQRPVRPLSGKGEVVARAAWKAHLHTYIWVNLMLVVIWLMTGGLGGYFWPMWPMMGWGIGLVAHGTSHRAAAKAREERRRRELPG